MFTDWQQPELAVNLPPEVTNGGNLSEEISKNMLDAYAIEAREDHKITLERGVALIVSTGQQGFCLKKQGGAWRAGRVADQ